MRYESFIGLRFLKPKRRQVLISVIGLISIVGVMVGVATLIVVISVITGFQDTMQTKSLEAFSHLLVLSYLPTIKDYPELIQRVEAKEGVEAVTPFIYGEVMLASDAGVGGMILRGVNAETVMNVTGLAKNMKLGSLESINELHFPPIQTDDPPDEPSVKRPGILVGEELAANLHVVLGSEVRVISPLGESTPMGMMPKMRRYVVTGVFSTGLLEFDSKFGFISLEQAQSFFNMGDAITGLEMKVDDVWQAKQIGLELQNELGWPFRTKDWMEMNRNLYSALKLEKVVMFVIVSLIMFVAALNIFSTLYMLVMDKKKSIAILKTMGATEGSIQKIFMRQGILIGVLGSAAGFILGVGLCLLQMKVGLVRLDPQVYFISELPMKFALLDFTLIALAAAVFSFAATIIPARIAARFDPVKVLRYE
jgi:lipoprotein-releasing system permease protein